MSKNNGIIQATKGIGFILLIAIAIYGGISMLTIADEEIVHNKNVPRIVKQDKNTTIIYIPPDKQFEDIEFYTTSYNLPVPWIMVKARTKEEKETYEFYDPYTSYVKYIIKEQ